MKERFDFKIWFSKHVYLVGFLFAFAYVIIDLILNSFISRDLDQGFLNFIKSSSGIEDLSRFILVTAFFLAFSVFTKKIIMDCKKTEDEQREHAKEIKDFAYSISHDLKSPAIGLFGLTKRLRDKYSEKLDEKGRSYCTQIMKAAEYIVDLVGDINTYIQTREIPMHFENLNILEIIHIVKEEFSARIEIQGIAWHEPKIMPEVKADRLSLHRIFRNLIDNALKYGGENLSQIIVEFEDNQNFYVFSFHDNGEGIREEDQCKIFDLFQRLRSSKEVDGSGMGLAITKEIIENHGGRIWVESVPKKGTTFFFTIAKNL